MGRRLLTDLMRSLRCAWQVMSIDTLPDEMLLAIFDIFVVDECKFSKEEIDSWHSLVHACRRWRRIVFESPRRLNLRLGNTAKTPARDFLDVWPSLPLFIHEYSDSACETGMDNIIAVLERSDRVDQFILVLSSLFLQEALAVMLVPFPKLTNLVLEFAFEDEDESIPALPDSFLGRSAPCLQSISLNRIPFPGLPNLLLSTTHLVDLSLERIPHSGYISPETLATVLSTLASLETLHLEFRSQSHSNRTSRPHISTRSVLRALTSLSFSGVSDILEDFVARIDAPQLHTVSITFDHIVFDTPQLAQFTGRTPRLKAFKKARVVFEHFVSEPVSVSVEHGAVRVIFFSRVSGRGGYGRISVGISVGESNWPPSSLMQACTSCLSPDSPLSTVNSLYIDVTNLLPDWLNDWLNDMQDTEWLEVLLPFTAVRNLYLSEEFAQPIATALKELVKDGTTEVLPSLQKIVFQGPLPSDSVQEAIGQFVAARQVSTDSSLPTIDVIHRPNLY